MDNKKIKLKKKIEYNKFKKEESEDETNIEVQNKYKNGYSPSQDKRTKISIEEYKALLKNPNEHKKKININFFIKK